MLDGLFRSPVNLILDTWAGRVRQGGMRANTLTLIAFLLGLIGCVAGAMQIYPLALLLILLNRFLTGLAGAVARQDGITALGSYLDILCDFVFFGSFVFFISLGASDTAIGASAFVLLSYLAMVTAYLGQTTFTARANILDTPRGGLVEKTEMTLFLVISCLYPPAFAAFAILFGLMCLTTAALRMASAVRSMKASD